MIQMCLVLKRNFPTLIISFSKMSLHHVTGVKILFFILWNYKIIKLYLFCEITNFRKIQMFLKALKNFCTIEIFGTSYTVLFYWTLNIRNEVLEFLEFLSFDPNTRALIETIF